MRKAWMIVATAIAAAMSMQVMAYNAGTYTGTTPNGRNGAITVEVVTSADMIESVIVTEHGETPFVSDKAIEEIPKRIVEEQSLSVDTITGATLTSYGVINAVKDALSQSGADIDELTKEKEKKIVTEDISIDADLIVVGAGAAGCMTAVRAAEQNPEAVIILLEKNANIGGNAVVSGGYIGVNTPPEELACLATDELQDMARSYMEVNPIDDFSEKLIEQAKIDYEEYLQGDTTYVFMDPYLSLLYAYMEYPLPYTQDLQEKSVLKTDDMFMWFYNRGAKFAPLLGVAGYAYPESTYLADYYSGAGYFEYLEDAIKEHENITLLTDTPATKLLKTDKAVTGVIAESRDGKVYTISAKDGVILATGGYAHDTERVKETDTYWGERLPERLLSDNISGTTSQAMDMAVEAGAAVDALGFAQLFPFANPKTGECHDLVGMDGILVNKEGKRTVNETSDRQVLSDAIFAEEDDIMWLISDANISWIADGVNMFGQDVQTMLDRGYLYKADTIEDLADLAGIDSDGLVQTIDNYNSAAMGEAKDETGRIIFDGLITEAPFYAQPRKPASHITYGGIVRNNDMQVLNEEETVIPGLYVIGDASINGGGITGAFTEGMLLAEQIYPEE